MVFLLVGFLSGILIGCVGIGGIFIVPVLSLMFEIPIQQAIGIAMMGYILTAVIGTFAYAREGTIRFDFAGFLCLGAVPGAFLGAWLSKELDPRFLELCIGLLGLLSGLQLLRGKRRSASQQTMPKAWSLFQFGVITGLISALTGTSGPLVLIPLLTWAELPMLLAIGLSQIIQLPIAILATVGNLLYGSFDIQLGLLLGGGLMIGTYIGAKFAHALPLRVLERLAASILVFTGVFILGRLAVI